jgi:cellulose synthase/poly-beta-1,6-N-acetylglucosamine synthase-like glycosyltransferase
VAHNFHGVYHVFDFVLFLIVSYVVWHQIFMELLTWSIARRIHAYEAQEPQPGLKVAFITTYVPGAETPELLHNILPAMTAADYPHDTWLLDEGNDAEAQRICQIYGVQYFTRHGTRRYNTYTGKFAAKTKGGNHNAWYDHVGHRYDIVAQIDTDFVPQRNFLTRTLGYFRNPTVAFVGTPQVYGNLGSWIARGAAQQQYNFYGPVLRGLYGHQMMLMLGANHIVRVSALRHIGYYAGHITEDLLTGMTLHSKWYRSVYVPEQLAVGEGPATWQAYFNQQMRWAYGCIDILLRHSPRLLRDMRRNHGLHYYLLQQHYFSGLASMLGVTLLTLYFLFGVVPAAMFLVPALFLYVPLLAWQYVIHRWLQRFYVNPHMEKGLNIAGMLISIAVWPIYFLAFISALRKKRLVFKVTPKGERSPQTANLKLFIPHMIIGTITGLDLLVGLLAHHTAVVMVFWASVTTLCMYGIAFHQPVVAGYKAIKKILRRPTSRPRIQQETV